MKSLVEFIKDDNKERIYNSITTWHPAPKLFEHTLENYIYQNLHYDDYIDYDSELSKIYKYNVNFIESLNKCRRYEIKEKYNQLINESLKSFSIKSFITALYKQFNILNDEHVSYEIIDSSNSENESAAFRLIIDWHKSKNKRLKRFLFENLDEILKLCKFYRYCISRQIYDYKGLGYGYILFEPLDTKDITHIVNQYFNGKIYHVSSKLYIDSIKKYGLKISSPAIKSDYNDPQYFMSTQELVKNSNDKRDENEKIDDKTIRGQIRLNRRYRNFTDRTFVFYTNDDILEAAKYVYKKINKKPEDSILIEINLNAHKNPFFRDTMMIDDESIHYAYSNIDIPAKMISNVIEL